MSAVPTSGPWPSATDYVGAVQDAAGAFHHPELVALRLRPGLMGLPAAATGQNAIVFDADGPDGRTALRCFTSVPHRGDDVYRRLEAMDLPDVLVPVRWRPDALEVHGARWPVVTMPWIAGDPLQRWVGAHVHRPTRIAALADAWVEACRVMYASGVAHGDLQHGNVLVTSDDQLRFIDFDGVLLFDPVSGQELTDTPTEVGHPNYQHPQRIEDGFSSRFVDTFSALLIHTTLRALVTDPGLWAHHRGENLVLAQSDLFEPESSEPLRRMRASGDPLVAHGADLLARWCRTGVRANLTLADVLGPRPAGVPAPARPGIPYHSRAAEREAAALASTPTAEWSEAQRPEVLEEAGRHAQYRGPGLAPSPVGAVPPADALTPALPSEPGVRTPGMVDQRRDRFLRTVVLPVVLGVMGGALLLVLAIASGLPGRLLPPSGESLPAMLEVGSCFVVDASGRVAPERCSARNDGSVIAEVVEAEACERLAEGARTPFAVVEGRTFCLLDRQPPQSAP
jgi:hypothetical protein